MHAGINCYVRKQGLHFLFVIKFYLIFFIIFGGKGIEILASIIIIKLIINLIL